MGFISVETSTHLDFLNGVLRRAESAENEPKATQMAISAVKYAMAHDQIQSGVLAEILQRREDSRQFTPRELLDTSEMMIEALVAVQALYNEALAALEAKPPPSGGLPTATLAKPAHAALIFLLVAYASAA